MDNNDTCLIKAMVEIEEASSKRPLSFIDLFNTKPIILRTLNMMFQWLAVSMCFYGLTFASTRKAKKKDEDAFYSNGVKNNTFLSRYIEFFTFD